MKKTAINIITYLLYTQTYTNTHNDPECNNEKLNGISNIKEKCGKWTRQGRPGDTLREREREGEEQKSNTKEWPLYKPVQKLKKNSINLPKWVQA